MELRFPTIFYNNALLGQRKKKKGSEREANFYTHLRHDFQYSIFSHRPFDL
jgi:hypothetical protein